MGKGREGGLALSCPCELGSSAVQNKRGELQERRRTSRYPKVVGPTEAGMPKMKGPFWEVLVFGRA